MKKTQNHRTHQKKLTLLCSNRPENLPSPTAEENRKIRNFLIANIQLGNNSANESENVRKIDILALFNRYNKTFLQNGDKNPASGKLEELEAKIQKLKARNKKLKRKSMSESQTALEKLDQIDLL